MALFSFKFIFCLSRIKKSFIYPKINLNSFFVHYCLHYLFGTLNIDDFNDGHYIYQIRQKNY
jgi:hypothetical protein